MGLGIGKICRNLYAITLLGGALFVIAFFSVSAPAQAAAGINQEINFQGRLLNSQGAIVSDGYYNVEFKIYKGGDGLSTGDTTPAGSPGTLLWTEDYVDNNANAGVQVINGYMSVQLGSICPFTGGSCQGHSNTAVDWNDDTLWLSMNIAGSTNTCTTFGGASCTADGEMVPMKRMSANAYALNTSLLGGLSSAQYVQLAQGLQTDATTNTSIYINKTSTGNFIDYQTSGADSFIVNNSGNEVFGASANHSISVATAAASTAGTALTVAAGAAGTGASALTGGTLTLNAGAGGGTNGNGGNLALDAGAANGTGTAGTISIGTNNASNITLGNSSNTTQAKVQAGGATSTLTNNGGEAVQGSDSSSATNAMEVTNGNGQVLFQLVDDGTVNIGENPSGGYAFGYNSIGANGQDSGDTLIDGQKFTASTTENIASVSIYIGPNVEAAPYNKFQVGIYTDNAGAPGSYIASSAVGTLTANSWNTLAVSASVTSGTTYWLVVSNNVQAGQGTADATTYTSPSSGNTHFYETFTFGSGPDNGLPASLAGATIVNNVAESMYASTTAGPAVTINNNGIITTPTTFQNTANTTAALAIQNSSGNKVLDVDTNNNQVILGQASQVNGLIQFQSTGGGYVAMAAPSISSGNSYSLTLPTAAPTATNQCLQSSSTFTQLTFGACGTVGSFIDNAFASTQAANFNIQGTSSTAATAVLEANNGGTGDILDLLNGSGATVATFDKSGNFVDSATGTSSFAGTLTVATKVVTPTLDTASSVPLNIGSSASQINLNQNVQITGNTTYASGANRSIGVAAAASGNGNNLSINAGAGATGGNNNGGNVNIDAGAKAGTGVDGLINIGTNHASAINVGSAGVTTTNNGNLAVNGQASVGSSTTNGSLAFNNTSSHTITLNNTGATNTYTLTLPTSAPAAGLCLETSPGAASQLVFASCTNNNSSIQEVHEWDANNTNTVTISPTTIGDEVVLTTQIPTSSVTVTGISGGNVATWSKIVANNGNGTVNRVEMWAGTVTNVGSSTITVTYSSSPGAEEVTATEFTAAGVNASTSWGIESSNSLLNSSPASTFNFPSATAVDGSELYVGYAQVQNPPATAGSTTDFNYIITSTQHNVITYDPNLTANTAYQPAANQNSAGESNTVDAVLTAFVTSTSINNTTSLQKANFYVQAASSGTIAGILQAASGGTADIFDIRNSSGTANYLTVGSTGNLTLAPATSTTALQVQNSTSGNGVFTVDTTNNQAVLGSSTHIAGTLTFDDVSDTNSISLQAPSAIAASYTLSLPTNTPTAGLCLGTSPSNANQLIFASCATQVSAAGISYVNKWTATGTGNTNVPDSPSNKGNLLIVFSHTTGNATISGISGGGATSWTKVNTYNSAGGTQGNIEMWRGVVATAGAGTVAVSYTGTVNASDVSVEEFTMGSASGTWAIDTSGTANSTSATTINYPTLTAQNSSELYTGYAWGANTMSAGTTTGFTWLTTAASKYLAYDTAVTGGIAYTPTASQGTAGAYASIGAMVEAYSGTSVIVSTTATQEANFNVQAATAGTVAGVLQEASGGSADVLDVRDSSGNNILAVNPSGTTYTTGTTLGTAGAVGGQLNFASSSNTNIISILAPSAPGASYLLTLPTTTPAPGQCLASSPSNANQLVFSSCANQVTSVAITYVNGWTGTSSGNTLTITGFSPTSIGDLITVFVAPQKGNAVTGVSSSDVASWSQITSTSGGTGMAMWRGQVTSLGASSITITMTGAAGSNDAAAYEFTTGSTTGSWVVDTSNTLINSTGSTTVTYPNLTPQSTKDLYVGYARGTSTMSAGATTGFSYATGGIANDMVAYNTSVSSTIQPTANQSTSGTSTSAGALIAAYSSSSVIANSTNTQQANFNVQAATSGSVAGVLQAYFTGSADILDILNGSGTLTDSFGSTGNLLVQPSTASAAALQVQTTGGTNVFSIDTSAKLVNVGAGATGESSPSLLVLDSETGTTADPTEKDGAMYYNVTTKSMRCGVDGTWTNCNSLLYANTSASSANNNCTNNCSAFSTTASIPANYCQPGRVMDLYASGTFSSQSSASNLQFGVYYGTDGTTASNDTLLGTLTPQATVTSASNNYFQMNDHITCFSTTTMQIGGLLSIQTGSSGSGMLMLPMGAPTGTTVVSSSAKNIYIFPVWDVASTSNTATMSQLTLNTY